MRLDPKTQLMMGRMLFEPILLMADIGRRREIQRQIRLRAYKLRLLMGGILLGFLLTMLVVATIDLALTGSALPLFFVLVLAAVSAPFVRRFFDRRAVGL